MRIEKILLLIIVFINGFLIGAVVFQGLYNGFDRDILETDPIGFWQSVNNTDSFYCVWVDNLSRKTIATTEYHEACHELIDKDYKHFCEE